MALLVHYFVLLCACISEKQSGYFLGERTVSCWLLQEKSEANLQLILGDLHVDQVLVNGSALKTCMIRSWRPAELGFAARATIVDWMSNNSQKQDGGCLSNIVGNFGYAIWGQVFAVKDL